MNTQSQLVAEFLGGVPLLQRLPSSSINKIAQLVKLKRYDRGDFIIRKGDSEAGVYFVWEGEAEVCGHEGEEIRREFLLKRGDYFGHACQYNNTTGFVGAPTSEAQVEVVASSKLTCLLLPSEHCALLWPRSIWSAVGHKTSPSIERILDLDLIEVNVFQGITLPDAPKFQKIYGGQFIGQALAAASRTVDRLKIVHHLQGHFLLVGDYDTPVLYKVHCLHDGKSFASRRVDAVQKGKVIFTLLASFQIEDNGFEHQEAVPPSVPPPDVLLSIEELRERRIIDPRFPQVYRNNLLMSKYHRWPIEIRFCDPSTYYTQYTKVPPSIRYWFRANIKMSSSDQALHSSVVAYASDFIFFHASANPHRTRGLKIYGVSLNHSIWFHRPVKADDWLLFVIESPSAHAGRGFASGQMFNRNGELVASLVQEGVLRAAKAPNPTIRAKY